MHLPWKSGRSRQDSDIPDYKAIPLRWPFLALLFVLICTLLGMLEWVVRLLPNEEDRDGMPHDFARPWKRSVQIDLDQPRIVAASQPRFLGDDLIPMTTTATTTSSSTTTAQPRITQFPRDPRLLGGNLLQARDPRPCDTCYANTEPIRTYITYANQWTGEQRNLFGRKPIFPGDDTAGECVYHYQGVVMTDDPTACLAVIGPGSGTYNIPVGWVRATWLNKDIWFPPGGCDKMYDEWYAGEPSTQKRSWDEVYTGNITHVELGWSDGSGLKLINWLHGLEYPFYRCTDIAGPKRRAVTTIPATTTGPSENIMFVYFGIFFHRYDDGRIDWNIPEPHPDSRGDRRLHAAQARSTPSGYYFLRGVDLTVLSTPFHSSTTSTPVVITSSEATSTPTSEASSGSSVPLESSSPAETSASSLEPTPSSSYVEPSSTEYTLISDPPETTRFPTRSPVFVPSDVTFVNIPVLTTLYSEIRTSSNGTLVGIQTTYIATSHTVLVQLPAVMVPATTYTTTNSLGSLTTVTTVPGEALVRTVVTTTTDPAGSPTTITTVLPATSVVTTLTNARGQPTATVTTFPIFPHIPGATPADIILPSSNLTYLTVYFLPLLLTLLLLIPLQSLDAEIKLLLPFRALSRPGGSTSALTLRTDGFRGYWTSIHLLRDHDPLSFLSDLIMLVTAVLVSLSGETVGLKLRGNCIDHNLNTCFVTLAVFRAPARAAEALLVLLGAAVIGVWWCLRKKTGIAAHPGSVAAVAVLLQGREAKTAVRDAARDGSLSAEGAVIEGEVEKRLRKGLEGRRFFLGGLEEERAEGYGIVGVDCGRPLGVKLKRAVQLRERDGREEGWLRVGKRERAVQGSFLVLLAALLGVVLYYELVVWEDPSMNVFEWFMDSQGFGVNFVFTGLGVLIQFVWEDFCSDFFKLNTYRRMALQPQDAHHSVLEERVTNVFTGLWRAFRQKEPLAGAMAFAALLSKFLPLFLSGVPFATAQTFYAHEICTWGSIALLIIMVIILAAHMALVKWPYMPVSLDSLAGCIYYVCDSAMLADFAKLSMLDKRERDLRIQRMGRKYKFGWITGLSGERRVAVDYAEGESGYQLKSLGPQGFGIGGEIKGK